MNNTATHTMTDGYHHTDLTPPQDTLDELNQMLSQAREADNTNDCPIIAVEIGLWIMRLTKMVNAEFTVQKMIAAKTSK